MAEQPLVSVVVPTYNSEEHLYDCLASIDQQFYDPIEIVVVDNRSTDRTREIAREFTEKVYTKGPERCAQLNFGFEKAAGEYLYRVDSDFLLDPRVVEEAVERCGSGADAVYVHNTSDPTVSLWARVRKFERDFYRGDDLNVAARFFRKEVIDDVGGFDEELIACEDYDLHNRILSAGYDVATIEAKEVHLDEPETIRNVVHRNYSYGKSLGKFIEKNPDRGREQVRFLRSAHRRQWKRFVENPHLTACFAVYQAVRYASAGIGLGLSRLHGRHDDDG